MPLFETEYEKKLYDDRLASLEKITAIARELTPGLTEAEARYPNTFRFTHTLTKAADEIPALLPLANAPDGTPLSAEQLEAHPVPAAIAGRLMTIRGGFAVLQQGGQRLQIYVHKDAVGPQLFALYKLLHIGDHIGVRGTLMRTRTGELTLKVRPLDATLAAQLPNPGDHAGKPALQFLAKAMLALPDKYHGLEDIESRYRQRYVDLIMNSGNAPKAEAAELAEEPAAEPRNVRETFVKRAAILRAIRRFFDTRGYLEVETPMMHTIAGGAAARPFKTHHNALDIDLSLRIAPELFLKRLVVGGLDRVYEINRNFRNEGISTQHNPEFTMLEFYQAYANYHDLMNLTQELITYVANEVNGTTITHFNGNEIDLSKWQKLSMREAIVKFWPKDEFLVPLEMADLGNAESLFLKLQLALDGGEVPSAKSEGAAGPIPSMQGVDMTLGDMAKLSKGLELPLTSFFNLGEKDFPAEVYLSAFQRKAKLLNRVLDGLRANETFGKLIAELFEAVAEEHLIQPTIIYDFPLAVSPLSKIKPNEPDWVERFEFYIGGFEVGNAFSELNDPADQQRRFEDQLKEKERGDDEAHAMDEDYVRALGYGLPPTAGEGIGIDRLTMLLTGSRSIRDVILFPLMRPHTTAEKAADHLQQPGGESAE